MPSCGHVYRTSGTCDVPNTSADLLRRAARIRQHALHFVDDPIAEHLGKYADELEARAARLAGE
jgi:hypothetical protein